MGGARVAPEVEQSGSPFSVWRQSHPSSAGSDLRGTYSLQKLYQKLKSTKGKVFLLADDDMEKDGSDYFPLDLQSLYDADRLPRVDEQKQTNDLEEDKPEFNVLNGDLLALE